MTYAQSIWNEISLSTKQARLLNRGGITALNCASIGLGFCDE